MMRISELVQTAGWRKFMAKLYGWGASVVLIGALAKLQHWPWAGVALIMGMTTEAIIFFFSAFEPVSEEVDWSIVYPELAGIEEDPEEARERNRARRQAMSNFPESGTAQGGAPQQGAPGGGAGGGNGAAGMSKFDEMLENAEITPELFNSLGDGLKKLNETTKNINDISSASLATNEYVDTMQAAKESVNLLTESYNKSHTELNKSIDDLANTYQESAESIKQTGQDMTDKIADSGKNFADKINESGEDLANAYKEISETVRSSILDENNAYNEKLEKLNQNLSALNSAYELQLNNTNEHVKTTESLYGEMDKIMNDLRSSVDETKKYKEEMEKLNESLSELNNVYGNMLSSMSVLNNNA
jgi:gliding motility-associated protein GldL